jgi:hypothetical protein
VKGHSFKGLAVLEKSDGDSVKGQATVLQTQDGRIAGRLEPVTPREVIRVGFDNPRLDNVRFTLITEDGLRLTSDSWMTTNVNIATSDKDGMRDRVSGLMSRIDVKPAEGIEAQAPVYYKFRN